MALRGHELLLQRRCGGWCRDFLHIHGDDFVFGAHGVFVAFAAGDDVHEDFVEVKSAGGLRLLAGLLVCAIKSE